jgi:membrane protein DedA with SNARE-associated domain
VKEFVALLQSWGPFGSLLLAMLDSAGIPIPGGVDALIIFIAITRPDIAIATATTATVGSAAGCLFLFWVARKGGRAYLERHANSARAIRFRRWFDRYGLLTVFIPALVPIPLPVKVFVLSAGALGTRPILFLAVVIAARIPRYYGLAWLGSQLGSDSLPWLKAHALHLTAFAAALFLVLYVFLRARGSQTAPSS